MSRPIGIVDGRRTQLERGAPAVVLLRKMPLTPFDPRSSGASVWRCVSELPSSRREQIEARLQRLPTPRHVR